MDLPKGTVLGRVAATNVREGDLVKTLQQKLAQLGFELGDEAPGKWDYGTYGDRTEHAVRTFQSEDHGFWIPFVYGLFRILQCRRSCRSSLTWVGSIATRLISWSPMLVKQLQKGLARQGLDLGDEAPGEQAHGQYGQKTAELDFCPFFGSREDGRELAMRRRRTELSGHADI